MHCLAATQVCPLRGPVLGSHFAAKAGMDTGMDGEGSRYADNTASHNNGRVCGERIVRVDGPGACTVYMHWNGEGITQFC